VLRRCEGPEGRWYRHAIGSLPYKLAADLRDRLGLERAVETGTFQGGGARALAAMFPTVLTIELSDRYFELASAELAAVPNIVAEHGASPAILERLGPAPTFYWLDAHWSGLDTAGEENPCPVLEEIAAIPAHPADCLLIDDARLFAATREPDRWPTLVRVLDALREARPGAHVTVLHDLILCVPPEAKDLLDDFGMEHAQEVWAAGEEARLAGSGLDAADSQAPPTGRLRQLARYAAGRRR
jgi:hypothetical protein